MSGGAFQTSREIFENPIWQDIPKFRIFFYIVGNAVFSEEGVRKGDLTIKRGQYLRSYRNLQSDLEYLENRAVKKYSLSVIKRKIDSLIKEERLKIEETELGTLFTVVNYDTYQGFEHYKKREPGTALERSENRDGTGMEQGWNNNNKDNKVNKDKNDNIPSSNDDSLQTEFDEFWNIYKKKTDKKKSFEKFKAKRKKFSFEEILEGTKKYMRKCEAEETEVGFIKGPAVFLNGDGFTEEWEIYKKTAKKTGFRKPEAAVKYGTLNVEDM